MDDSSTEWNNAKWVREVRKKYGKCKDPVFLRCGRKPRPITDEERKIADTTFVISYIKI